MEQTICQSCGMPMAATEHFGTNSDNSRSSDYCCFCFQNGAFTDSMNLEETIEDAVLNHDSSEMVDGRRVTKDEAELKMRVFFPTLKRWSSHQVTHQEYFKSVNRAVDYINEHLSETINLSDLSEIANISGFHFHRIFKAVMNESPGDYIQRLRLERTAFMLQTTGLTVTEIADCTGYQSPHALSKAFKKHFQISPSVFRIQPAELTVPLEPVESISLTPEIKRIEPKEVIYIRVQDPYRQSDAFAKAWSKLLHFTGANGIPDQEHEYITLSRDVSTITKVDQCRIYACTSAPENLKPAGQFGKQTIKGGLYAVFSYKGPYKMLEAIYCNIYRNWIPNSNYELRDIAFFEKYLNNPDHVDQENLLTEIYIPVRSM